ncbi:hypothetical protein [Acinetobacter guerrae]|uniref:hypothetical protein n=1 Tax=Acinetobacter guerrae TaxID=1843371 RepID=UPI0030C88CAB
MNKDGVFITTGDYFKVKSGQNVFMSGAQVKAEIPLFPTSCAVNTFTNKWDMYELFYEHDLSKVEYKIISKKNNTYISASLDENGRTQRVSKNDNEDYDILIGIDDDWTVSLDNETENEDFQYICNCGMHDDHEKEI